MSYTSERRLAETEKALHESEAYLRSVFRVAPTGIGVVIDRVFKQVNRHLCEMTGYDESELVGKGARMLYPDDEEFETVGREKYAQIRDQGTGTVETRWECKDGTVIDVLLSSTPLDLDDLSEGVTFTALDITERNRAVALLRREKAFSDAAIESLPGVFYVFNDKGRFLRWNRHFETVSGYSGAEISRLQPGEFFCPEDYDRISKAIQQVFDTGWSSVEATFLSKDGTRTPYLMTGAPQEINDQSCVVGMGLDISERRAAEEARLNLERQVQHAQKLESLGVLAGGIAHDFNNLLMGILGNADLALLDMAPEAPARENIVAVETAARRAADLAKQMLAYSGKGKFVIDRLDLQTMVEEMMHLLDVSISKKVVIRCDYGRNVPPIEADATQVRQVIMNLVVNASESMGNASGAVSIRTGAMECDRAFIAGTYHHEDMVEGVYSWFEVADTGNGMDEKTLSRIFDPFFTTKFTGRGLGLAAVLGIVRGHGGAINVTSEPGRGTAFRVLFPISEGAVTDEVPEGVGRDDVRLDGRCALLVDDEETVRTVGKRMLEQIGMEVVTADDGQHALNIFTADTGHFDIVILDLTMPRMDGEEAFRELRRLRPGVRVLLSSGYNEQELIARFAGEGPADFIQKPYRLETLRAAVLKTLGP